MTAPAFI